MDNDLIPARIVIPGQIIKKEIDALDWTQKHFAERLGRSPQLISKIINGKARITSDIAVRLSHVLGISIDFWMNLEANYRKNSITQPCLEATKDLSACTESDGLNRT